MTERQPDRFVPLDEWARRSTSLAVRIRARLRYDSRFQTGRLEVEGALVSYTAGPRKIVLTVGPVVIDSDVWFITDWARIEDCPRD
jgi:hypothetical protein